MAADEAEDPEHPLGLDRIDQIRDLSDVLSHDRNILGTNATRAMLMKRGPQGMLPEVSLAVARRFDRAGERWACRPPDPYGRISGRLEVRPRDTCRRGCHLLRDASWR